jgi:rubrerythrin
MKKNTIGRMFDIMEQTDPSFKRPINETMSDIPADANDVEEQKSDAEILRAAIISELDAINLYEQFSAKANNEKLKKLLLDIAKEEKTHVGEFEALLLTIDKEQKKEMESGKKEAEDVEDESEKEDDEDKSIEIDEGNAFVGAAKKAKAEGKDSFELGGKTYKVTVTASKG